MIIAANGKMQHQSAKESRSLRLPTASAYPVALEIDAAIPALTAAAAQNRATADQPLAAAPPEAHTNTMAAARAQFRAIKYRPNPIVRTRELV
jgi:hypothetical protein